MSPQPNSIISARRENQSEWQSQTWLTYFTSALLVLFTFSGTLKWLPDYLFDPTLLFGLPLAVIVALRLVQRPPRFELRIGIVIVLTLLFVAWHWTSAIYSHSERYWSIKALALALNLLSFVGAVVLLDTPQAIRVFLRITMLFTLAAAVVVLAFYCTDNMAMIYEAQNRQYMKIPNYLVFGYLVGINVLLAAERPTRLNLLIGVLGVWALLVLPGRGPFLFTILMIVFGYVLYLRGRYQRMKRSAILVAYLGIIVVGFFFWGAGSVLMQRFSAMYDFGSRTIEMSRVAEFEIALRVIRDAPLLGVGLGGYGEAAYAFDDNAYPHNLILEAFAETGLLGGIIFTSSIVGACALGYLHALRVGNISLFLVLIFTAANYMKSGGFVGARDLYMFMGAMLAAVSVSKRTLPPFAAPRFGPAGATGRVSCSRNPAVRRFLRGDAKDANAVSST